MSPQAPQILFGDKPDLAGTDPAYPGLCIAVLFVDPWEGELRGRLDSPAPSDPWGDLTSAPSDTATLQPVNLTNEIVMYASRPSINNNLTKSLNYIVS